MLPSFLRSASATFIVAASIPISVIGTFLAVTLLGRSLNVVMLAGMAFAVGMVVDNAIVVLENIYRHRQRGKSRFDAALQGGVQVWGRSFRKYAAAPRLNRSIIHPRSTPQYR